MNKDLCKPCTGPEILRFALFLVLVTAGIMVISLLISEVSGEQNQTQSSEYVTEYNWSEPNILYRNPIADWKEETHPFPFIVTNGDNSTIYWQCLTRPSDSYPPIEPWTDFIVRLNQNGKLVYYNKKLNLNTTFTDVVWTRHRSAIFLNNTNSFVWIEDSYSKNMTFYIYDLNGTLIDKVNLKYKGTVLDYCKDSEDNIHLVFVNINSQQYWIYFAKISPNGTVLIDKQEIITKENVNNVPLDRFHSKIIVDVENNPIIFTSYPVDWWRIETNIEKIVVRNNTILNINETAAYEFNIMTSHDTYMLNYFTCVYADADIHIFQIRTNENGRRGIRYYKITDNNTIVKNYTLNTGGDNVNGVYVKKDLNSKIHLIYMSSEGHHMILNTNGTILSDVIIGQPYYFTNGDFAIDSTGNLHLVANWGNKVLYMRTNAPADLSLGELPVDRPENLTYNLTLTIPVRITNPGTVDAREIPVRFEVNGTEIESRTISLGPGENTTLNFNLTLGYNWTNCTIQIDTMGRLIEARVSNNEVTGSFYVPPPPEKNNSEPADDEEDGFIPAFAPPLLVPGAALSALVLMKRKRGRLS